MASNNLLLADLNDTLVVGDLRGSWEWAAGAVPAVRSLICERGWRLAIVTNQPAKEWGGAPVAVRDAVLVAVRRLLVFCADVPAESITLHACLHEPSAGCTCRKPETGLLLRAMAAMGHVHGRCWMVGDKWSDVLAGQRAAVKTCKVGDFGYQAKGQTAMPADIPPPDLWVPDFAAAVQVITSEVL